ncbi:MAG: hypothetical protein FWH47_02130 [Methanomassiliicoccaceae archaeon]|nr:hypothetical protein [Methanomassiliicoccaceae archaeon]
MGFKKKVRVGKGGVSTILAVVIVVVVVAAAGSAAYAFLSLDKGKETVAIGTVLQYDIVQSDGTVAGTVEESYIGQSDSDYFIKVAESNASSAFYWSDPKSGPRDAKRAGTTTIDTIDGRRSMEVWEHDRYRGFDVSAKSYIDSSNGMPYRIEFDHGAYAYVLKWYGPEQGASYKESGDVGMAYEYVFDEGPEAMYLEVRCIADCIGGRYGVAYGFRSATEDFGASYFLCGIPQGLPSDAIDTKSTTTLEDTLDGPVEVGIWEILYDADYVLYYDPASQVIYRVVLATGWGEMPFELAKKP